MQVEDPPLRLTGPADLIALQPLIIYDGECIFCENYVKIFRARASLGKVRLVDARTINVDDRRQLMARYDLNQGMLFVEGGTVYHGSDAVHALALVTSDSGVFNRLNGLIFKSAFLSKLLYPFLKAGRRATLFIRGKKLIQH